MRQVFIELSAEIVICLTNARPVLQAFDGSGPGAVNDNNGLSLSHVCPLQHASSPGGSMPMLQLLMLLLENACNGAQFLIC